MREQCACGAAVSTLFYRRVLRWRAEHRHPEPRPPEPPEEPEPQGAGSSDNEIQYHEHDWSHPQIGFSPNGY